MLKGHPQGLRTIFFTEMWERLGFYTLMAVLVLYMDKGLGWPDARKGDVYGLFLGLCYFVPLLGGWLGDRVLGRLRTVRLGAVLMMAGYIGLAASSARRPAPFLAGLILIALGTGVFKVNQSVLVGALYADKPVLKDAGFNIFYMGVNVGAAAAPLLATAVSLTVGSYNVSFAICAAGMAVALAVLHAGRARLAPLDPGPSVRAAKASPGPASAPEMAPAEARQRIATLVTLYLIVIFFWVAFYQNAFALTLFAERSTRVLKLLRPETYQVFEPFFILVLTPVLLSLLARLRERGREPSTPVKILLGMVLAGIAMGIMVAASLAGGDLDRNIMSPAWLISTYLVVTVAEILISPMGQSFVSKVAPPHLQGLMMGGWFAATAAGSYGSGLLGRFYGDLPHHAFFLLLAGLLAVSAVLVLAFLRRLGRFSA